MSSTSSIVTRNTQGVEEIINYQFTNPKLICEALLAAGSYLPGIVRFSKDGNKNLALVGDSVLELVLVSDGYDKGLHKGRNKNNQQRERETQFLYQAPSTTSSARRETTHISLKKENSTTSTGLYSRIPLSATCRMDSWPTLWKPSSELSGTTAAKTFPRCNV